MTKFTDLYNKLIDENIEKNEIIEDRILTSNNCDLKLFLFDNVIGLKQKLAQFKINLIYKGNRFDEIFLIDYTIENNNKLLDKSMYNFVYILDEQNKQYYSLDNFLYSNLYSVNDFDEYIKTV